MPAPASTVLKPAAGQLHDTWESNDRLRSLEQIGWTEADWTALMLEDLTVVGGQAVHQLGGADLVRQWLLNPPTIFQAVVSPLTVRVTFAVHGPATPGVLDAYAAGASERFVAALLEARHGGGQDDPVDAWACARAAHLREPAATGWALTGRLLQSSLLGRGLSLGVLARHIRLWVERCGPSAYLWVLAGFTMDEATAMLDGPVVTDAQLRVMVDLNGMVLPAGV